LLPEINIRNLAFPRNPAAVFAANSALSHIWSDHAGCARPCQTFLIPPTIRPVFMAAM
jgi:hypothetical protein